MTVIIIYIAIYDLAQERWCMSLGDKSPTTNNAKIQRAMVSINGDVGIIYSLKRRSIPVIAQQVEYHYHEDRPTYNVSIKSSTLRPIISNHLMYQNLAVLLLLQQKNVARSHASNTLYPFDDRKCLPKMGQVKSKDARNLT